MSIDEKLLKILCCPESRQELHLLTQKEVDVLNDLQKQEKLKHRNGELVQYGFTGALRRSDKAVIYPIREDIPVLLIEESILIDQIEDQSFLQS